VYPAASGLAAAVLKTGQHGTRFGVG